MTEILGARPLRPGDLDEIFWPQEKHDRIVQRIKYLVHDDLEEPPQINEARRILKNEGITWSKASDEHLFEILNRVPRKLFHSERWDRARQNPECDELMMRIHHSEMDFYGFTGNSLADNFLYMLRDGRDNRDPESFYQRLKQAGVTIDKVVHFTRKTAKVKNIQHLSLPYQIEKKRKLFLDDLARFLREAQGSRSEIPHTTYAIPADDDRYIEEGIMKIDKGTLVFDTTLNGSVLQAIQEAGFRPGVIMRELTFWRDGDDEDVEALERVARAPAEYGVKHWLTQHYRVHSRPRGSGFVICNPTIYIRQGKSYVHALKRTASNLIRGDTFKSK